MAIPANQCSFPVRNFYTEQMLVLLLVEHAIAHACRRTTNETLKAVKGLCDMHYLLYRT